MRDILVVVDMQNDFINGSLGTKEAEGIIDNVVNQINLFKNREDAQVFTTQDTHYEDYLTTSEGINLPVEHCIYETYGWEINPKVKEVLPENTINIEKPTFGSVVLCNTIKNMSDNKSGKGLDITIIGLCTDICVISNALAIKAFLPEANIFTVENCCAGVTPEKHNAAIEVMKSCQIHII